MSIWSSFGRRWVALPSASTALSVLGIFENEAGTWTPTIEFLTMGDLSVVYDGTQPRVGTYLRIGNEVFVNYDLTFTPTYTTAASQLRIKTLPYAVLTTGFGPVVAGTAPGTMPTFPAGTTTLIGFGAGDQGVAIRAEGSAATSTVMGVGQFTSGVKYRLRGSFNYTRSV